MQFLRSFLIVAFLTLILMVPRSAYALSYDLIPPSGVLQRGQDVQFIIDIDTQGASVSNTQVGMTYQTQYLQFKSVSQGDAMTSVTSTEATTGTLLLTGTNTNGFTGTGTFAYVTFTLIATAPGSTELCVLFAPSVTPTPLTPTTPPQPTQLPKTGFVESRNTASVAGGVFILGALGTYLWFRHNRFDDKSRVHKHKHA